MPAGRYHFKDDWEFCGALVTRHGCDDRMITWEGISCRGNEYHGRDRGAAIRGTKGTVLMDRGSYQVFPGSSSAHSG